LDKLKIVSIKAAFRPASPWQRNPAHHHALLVILAWNAHKPAYFGEGIKNSGNGKKRIRHIQVVRIDPCHDLACTFIKSFLNRKVLPLVFFTYPVSQLLLIFFYHLKTVVRASAIDNNILKIWIALVEDRQYGLLQERAVVIINGYNGYFREFFQELNQLKTKIIN
jgi:hypothetical protein